MSKPKLDTPPKDCHDEGCARSQKQQRLMGMALACKRNDYKDCVSDEIEKLARSMNDRQLRKYAKTTHEGLPKKARTKGGKPDMRLKQNKQRTMENKYILDYDNFLNESTDTYEISFYLRNGEHTTNGKFYTNLQSAIKEAEKIKKEDEKNNDLGEEVLMIEVTSNSDFAIIFMSQEYFKNLNKNMFNDASAYNSYTNACKEYFKSKKTIIGKF